VSDIFDETEEELRTNKWVSIVKKSAPWAALVLGGALAIALGVWGWQSWQDNTAAKASETYQAAIEATSKNDIGLARTKFGDTAKSGTPAYKALALMQLAGLDLKDGKTDEAIKGFDAAAKAAPSPIIADLAALKAAYLAMDKASMDDIKKRLEPLAKEDRPYAPLAKEALAVAKMQNGDLKGARADLQVLALTLGTPEGVKQRAQEFTLAIDSGAVPTAQSALKLPEAKAPPQMPGLPEMPQ
jgi:hypothetical protein